MTTATRPSLLNLNIIDNTHKIGTIIANMGRSSYHSVRNATANDVKDFTLKAATNIGAGALTKAFVGAALVGASAPAAVTIGVTAISVAVVSTKITHWRDCKKAIANNEEPPKFNWKNYGLKGMFNAAMAGFGATFSEQILGFFTPSAANAEELRLDTQPIETAPPVAPVFQDIIEQPIIEPIHIEAPIITPLPVEEVQITMPELVTLMPTLELDIEPQVDTLAPIIEEPVDTPAPEMVETSVEISEIETNAPEAEQPEIIDVSDIETVVSIEPELPEPAAEPETAAEIVEITHAVVIDPIAEFQSFDLGERAQFALQNHINGNHQGTADIGFYYFHGDQGLPQNYERAVEFYREAAQAQNHYALRDLAYVEAEAEKALGYSVPANDIQPEVIAAEVEAQIEHDETLIEETVEQHIDSESEELAVESANIVEEPATLNPVEELQAMDLSARAENALQNHINGNHQGTADLGYYFFHGEQGLPQDYEKAVQFYREAAAEGNRYAIRDLAYIENQAEKALGYSVPQESAEEISVISEAEAELEPGLVDDLVSDIQDMDLGARAESALSAHLDGHAQGTADLAYFLFHGQQGLPQDIEKAVELYREAALNGNGYAIRDLAYVESQAEKAGIALSEFELPEHLYERSAPAIQGASNAGGQGGSGLRASCTGNLASIDGSRPSLQFDCSVRGNHGYIYPGEHASVRLPDNSTHVFKLDNSATREPVNDFLQHSVLPAASSVYGIN